MQYGPNAVLRARNEVACGGPCNGIYVDLRGRHKAEGVDKGSSEATIYFVDAASKVVKSCVNKVNGCKNLLGCNHLLC